MNGKVALQTVPKDKKVHVHHPVKKKKKVAPLQWRMFLRSWHRLCIAMLGIVVFCFEFPAGGFEGACRAGSKLMGAKIKL